MTTVGATVTLRNRLMLSYAETGDPTMPALLLLPGPTDSALSYLPVLEHISGGIWTIAVSQRGHGDSDKPASGYRVEDFAGDVVPLLDALRIERAVLAGHSGSCLTARRVAIDHPERVAGLVLEASPVSLVDNEQLQSFVDTTVAGLADPIDVDFARSFVVDLSSETVETRFVEVLVREIQKVPARVWREMFANLVTYDDTAELDRVTARTLLVWGDSDAVISSEMQNRLAQHLPDADLLVYGGVGHTPRWEDPVRFAADLSVFVTSLGA